MKPRADAANSRFHQNHEEAGSLAVVNLVKHPDNRWQVLHAEVREDHRRQGIMTMLYNRIEAILGTKLGPSGWLSDDAFQFWKARGCRYLAAYQQLDHLPGL